MEGALEGINTEAYPIRAEDFTRGGSHLFMPGVRSDILLEYFLQTVIYCHAFPKHRRKEDLDQSDLESSSSLAEHADSQYKYATRQVPVKGLRGGGGGRERREDHDEDELEGSSSGEDSSSGEQEDEESSEEVKSGTRVRGIAHHIASLKQQFCGSNAH